MRSSVYCVSPDPVNRIIIMAYIHPTAGLSVDHCPHVGSMWIENFASHTPLTYSASCPGFSTVFSFNIKVVVNFKSKFANEF